MENKEIECRFLEIDKEALIKKLYELDAEDHGEKLLEEIIIYDKDLKWRDENKRIRLRKSGNDLMLSYKEHASHTIDGTMEIEIGIDSLEKTELLLKKLGFISFRHQEKKRHTFVLDGVTLDIDTWPHVPTYVELEGKSEEDIKKVAKMIDYDWKDAVFQNPLWILENKYKLAVGKMKWFTFAKCE